MSRKYKKSVSILLIIAMISCMLMGCGEDGDKVEEEKKVLRVGCDCSWPPFSWTQDSDENGAVQIADSNEYVNGYDIMVAKRIAEELGYELQVVKSDFDALILGLNSGKYDAVIAAMGVTEERAMSVDFSEIYYTPGIYYLTKEGSEYSDAKSIEELSGCSVIAMQGTIYESVETQIPNAEIVPSLGNGAQCIVAVQSGTADITLMDSAAAMSAVKSNPDLVYGTFSDGMGFEVDESDFAGYAVAVCKGDTELLAEINSILENYTVDQQEADILEAIEIQPQAE